MPAYECSGCSLAAQHGSQNIAIKHSGNRDTFCSRYDARDFFDGSGERLTMMRPRASQQGAVDIEKDQGFAWRLAHCFQYTDLETSRSPR